MVKTDGKSLVIEYQMLIRTRWYCGCIGDAQENVIGREASLEAHRYYIKGQ